MSSYLDLTNARTRTTARITLPYPVSAPTPESVQGATTGGPESARPIIVLSHLGWNWVWQRPQQFLSRFAKTHPVLFVEWAEAAAGVASFDVHPAANCPGVTILRGRIPKSSDTPNAIPFRQRTQGKLLSAAFAGILRGQFAHPILWLYDPLAYPVLKGRFNESVLVFDCMDELSQFKGSPPELLACERKLVMDADVVFCGGQSMREKRLPLNPNCHFFGTGVDGAHFGQALRPDVPVAPEIAALTQPVLGYFGVVDERMDYELLADLADARRDWSIAIVGPHAKVDPRDFPQRPNLHFLGARTYDQLPAVTKGFSVCLMPFALNAATEFINPTKALEYMATGRPVVSTNLAEVRRNVGEVVAIAGSRAEFVELCRQAVARPDLRRIEAGLQLAARNSWESLIVRMERLVTQATYRRGRPEAGVEAVVPTSAIRTQRSLSRV